MANPDGSPALPIDVYTLDRSSKENRWYYKDLDDHLTPPSRKLLEDYSSIPAQDVIAHVHRMRDSLWSSAPYPCVGSFKFLTLYLPKHPLYKHMLSILQPQLDTPLGSGPYLLDLGCCVGQELRSLAFAGIPSSHLYGSDLVPSFLEKSYELFADQKIFEGTLVAANIFSSTLFAGPFRGWEHKFRTVHTGLFLHLFSWEQQVVVCSKIITLLAEVPGSLFLGEMVGCKGGGARGVEFGKVFWEKGKEKQHFLHDNETFSRMWDEVATNTGTEGQWKVSGEFRTWNQCNLVDGKKAGSVFVGEGIGWLTFGVERICGVDMKPHVT